MPSQKFHHQPKPIPIGRKEFGLSKVGASRFDLRDPYHLAVSLPWPGFILAMLACWLAINLTFASLYVLSPGAVANTAPGSFADVFFFSIETFSTIGYGNILPNGLMANLVVSAESIAGILFVALATGLIFARFSRPILHVRFSDHGVVAPYRNETALMFRLGNERRSELVSLTATVTYARFQDCDGVRTRLFDQLPLERSSVLFFPLTWTIVHPIDEQSPLHGVTQEDLLSSQAEFLILLTATEETFSQTVHTRTSYLADEIRWGAKFGNIFAPPTPEGLVRVDLRKIDAVEPSELPAKT